MRDLVAVCQSYQGSKFRDRCSETVNIYVMRSGALDPYLSYDKSCLFEF